MSVIGITNMNAAINTPYQMVNKSGDSKTGTFEGSGFSKILNAARIADLSRTKLEEQALLAQRKNTDNGVPYNYLAKDGIIEYNGVVFVCDEKYKAIRLGDTSDPKNCLNIPLSGGGSLIVNRDNLGDLAKAIGMFSPEDVNLIMRAIAQDAKIQQMKHQIDDETSGIDLADEGDEEETTVEEMQELNLDSTVYKHKENDEKEEKQ